MLQYLKSKNFCQLNKALLETRNAYSICSKINVAMK